MDKFGIFELLDALSAIAFEGDGNRENEKNDDGFAPSQPPSESDPAYRPPVYEGRQEPTVPDATQRPKDFAIQDFLSQHDKRAKR